jgi:cell division protein FtsB
VDSSFYRRAARRFSIPRALKHLMKNRKAMLMIGLGVVVIGYGVVGNHGILQRIRLQHDKAALERKIRDANEETKVLQQETKDLDTSKAAIEKVARERYGMARQGERVYKVTGGDH